MKSPNQNLSMKLIQTALQALHSAREDLKNDKRVRDNKLHIRLEVIEGDLERLQAALIAIGYNRGGRE